MLAHYPRRPSHTPFDDPFRHQSLDPFDPTSYSPSPSLSIQTPPFGHSPSPSYRSGKDQPQFHFDLSLVPAYCDSISSNSEGSDFYQASYPNSTSSSLVNPPIRIQSSSPAPGFSTSFDSQTSMLSDAISPNQWSTFEGMGHVSRPSSYSPSAQGRGHQRLPSGSSVASTGPLSPFSATTSHPHIVQSDAFSPRGFDSSWDTAVDQSQSKFSPSFLANDGQLVAAFQSLDQQAYDPQAIHEAKMAMMRSLQEQTAEDDGSALDYSTPGRPLSSVDHRSPMTPNTTYTEAAGDAPQPNGEMRSDADLVAELMCDEEFRNAMPKLDRSISNMCEDELYNPNLYAASTSSPSQSQSRMVPQNTNLLSPHRKVCSERLQAASQCHLRARSQSPAVTSSRAKSPFKPTSPFAPPIDTFEPPPTRLGSAAQMRERQIEADAQAQRERAERLQIEAIRPKTISPKEAMLGYVEAEEDVDRPLFSAEEANAYAPTESSQDDDAFPNASFGATRPFVDTTTALTTSNYTFVPPSVPGSVKVPQGYSTANRRRRQSQAQTSHSTMENLEFPAHLTSMESSVSEAPPAEPIRDVLREVRRPTQSTMADSGTYTCTYHGCPLRFETPAKLQKHKREGHRQHTPAHHTPASLSRASPQSDAALSDSDRPAAAQAHSQAGPHRCSRINPSTGKPCNTIFSRPYDLTRHEDTIHNNRKQKVRCRICEAVGEEKMFSRHDALTRHLRVVHPEVVEGQGRRGRRGDS
ncbi:MAG: hypothetical protein M1817_001929 [Caeruleum heppii]|nr:MAG: hypothetical protein M1817_001929 [Caeruleum heppii]